MTRIRRSGNVFAAAALLGLLASCTSGGTDKFQRNYPTDGTTLEEIKAKIPAIVSLFDEVDSQVTANKPGGMLEGKGDDIIQGIFTYSELTREPIPAMMDKMAYPIAELYKTYTDPTHAPGNNPYNGDPTEFNDAFNIGGAIVDIREAGVTQPTNTLADYVLFFGNLSELYPTALSNPFPTKSEWLDCDNNTFDTKFDTIKAIPVEEGRERMLLAYKNLRMAYCAFVGGYGDPDNAQGEFYYKYLVAKRASGHDFKQAMIDQIDYIENNIATIQSNEEAVTEWLVKNSNKKLVTDYLADDAYRLFKKDIVFNGMKSTADLVGSFFSTKNPDNTNEYLSEWLLKSAREDAPKIDRIDALIEVDTNNQLAQFIDAIFDGPPGGTDWVLPAGADPDYSIKQALRNMGSGTMTTGIAYLMDILWDGRSFPDADGGTVNIPNYHSLMYNDGSVTTGNPDAAHYSHYRLHMHDILNGDGDGNLWGSNFDNDNDDFSPLNPQTGMRKVIRPSYQGETMGQTLMTNLWLHLLETYFDPSAAGGAGRWAVSPSNGQAYFGDRDRNLLSFTANLQYAIRNAVVLDRSGKEPGESGFRHVPLIADLLYFFAIGGGYIQPTVVPEQGTMRASLNNLGAGDLGLSGTIEALGGLYTLRVFCNGNDCDKEDGEINARPFRNGHPISVQLNASTLEFLTPGRYRQRDKATEGPMRGTYTAQQGDTENADGRIGLLLNSLIADNAWLGHGPFSHNGKAPNGSKVKFKNHYYTDNYRSETIYGAGIGGLGTPGQTTVALGNNNGEGGSGTGDINYTGYGNLHIYERVYRPMAPGDPCWDDAKNTAGTHAEFAYLRPDNNNRYVFDGEACDGGAQSYQANNPSVVDPYGVFNTSKWAKIRVDFKSREEAIKMNFLFLMRDKKMFAVIPIVTNLDVMDPLFGWIRLGGAAINNYLLLGGNGLIGVLKARSAGDQPNDNGKWWLSNATLNAATNGVIPNNETIGALGTGFLRESPGNGASLTRRWSHMSYLPTDSTFTYMISMRIWGLASLLADLSDMFFEQLGASTFSPPLTLENVEQLETLINAQYDPTELQNNGAADNTVQDMGKFRKFYDTYFKTDMNDATGNPGANGISDLYDAWLQSATYPGCMNGTENVEFCVTDEELPTLPKVNGVVYPLTFDGNGKAATWYTHTDSSDGKFEAIVLPLVMMMGNTVEGTDVIDDATGAAVPAGGNVDETSPGVPRVIRKRVACNDANPTDASLPASCTDTSPADGHPDGAGYRAAQLAASRSMNAIGDLVKHDTLGAPNGYFCPLDETGAQNTYCSKYESSSWLISLIENSPGARDGLLPTLLQSSKFHLAFAKFMIDDGEALINDTFRNSMERLELTKASNIDKFRYLTTGDVVTEGAFPRNYLKSIGDEPFNFVKKVIGQIRSATSDAEVVQIIKNTIPVLNALTLISAKGSYIKLDDDDIDQIVNFVNRETSDSNCPSACEYVIDKFLDFMTNNGLNDIKSLTKINLATAGNFIDEFKSAFDDLNEFFIDEENKDLRKNILYGVLMDEPCDKGPDFVCNFTDADADGVYDATETGDAFLDFNGNGRWDQGMFTFRDFYTGTYATLTDTTDVNGAVQIVQPAPNFFNIHAYDIAFGGGVGKVPGMTRTSLDNFLNKFTGQFDGYTELEKLKDKAFKFYDEYIDEPSFDRNGNGTIDSAEVITHIPKQNGVYDPPEPYIDSNTSGTWELGEQFTDLDCNGTWTAGEPFTDSNGNTFYDVGESYTDESRVNCDYEQDESFIDVDPDGPGPLQANGLWDWAEYTDVNGDGLHTLKTVLPESFTDRPSPYSTPGVFDGPEVYYDANKNNQWDTGEPYVDKNGNGDCDWEVGDPANPTDPHIDIWTDANGNGKWDGPGVTIREYIAYKANKFKTTVDELESTGKLKAITKAIGTLFHPNCVDYSVDLETCLAGSGNPPQNAAYLTEKFLKARVAFKDNIPFAAKDLKALKNVVGNALYDRANNGYTHLITRLMQGLVPIMRVSKETAESSVDKSIRSLAPDGSMRYTLNKMRLAPQFQEIHLLRDADTLLNIKVFREYGRPGTFWQEVSDLIASFGKMAYEQNNMNWTMDTSVFYRFNDVFKK